MPIARRISQSALQAIQPAASLARPISGEYLIADLIADLADLPSTPPPPRPPPALRLVREAPQDAPGRMLDTAFLEDEVPLDLDLKALPSRAGIQTMAGVDVTTLLAPIARNISGSVDALPGVIAFAGFGVAPEGLSGAATYAVLVMMRRSTLRTDLKIARWRGLPKRDLDLYEAALRCADDSAMAKGIAVIAAGAVAVAGALAGFASFLL